MLECWIDITAEMRYVLDLSVFIILVPCFVWGNGYSNASLSDQDKENRRIEFLVDLIGVNLKLNGWSNVICAGRNFPDLFYVKLKDLHLTFTTIHPAISDIGINDVVPYHSNVVILNCEDFNEFEHTLRTTMASPHWHPHANTILYYHARGQEDVPKIFMIFWFYKVCNAIIIQYEDNTENFQIFLYNPYVGENYKLSHHFGCWKATKIGRTVGKFQNSFVCVEGCHNVTLHSKLRNLFLGTCIGYEASNIQYGDTESLAKLNLFEDKGKNLHGFVFKAVGGETLPFISIMVHDNGTYSLNSRDGMIWNTAAERMNFSLNLDAIKDVFKQPFDFDITVQQIYSFAIRQTDVLVFPIYQFDIIIVEIDLSIAYKDSGVCILSHRAGFETVLFDAKLLEENIDLVIKFSFCFLFIWLLFFMFNTTETGQLSFDQAGKDLVNTIRNMLSISLHKPPKRGTFRIYLGISMWCFFVLNFATQAAIISFFSAYKRGKEVDTFEDIIEKGYVVEGMASPDMMLPDDEERFQIINSKIVSLPRLYQCIERMANDSRRFCLIDCAIGRYLENNRLNEKGEQFLHVAKDRIHSHYLNMVLHKHSPLTKTFNKCLRMAFEAGLIKKWEQYRFNTFIDEVPLKALTLEDLIGIFKCYFFLLALSIAVFIIEVTISVKKRMSSYFAEKIAGWRRIRNAPRQPTNTLEN